MPFQKGHPGYRKGTKNKSTLLKEERRAIFDAEISKMWIETIRKMRPEYIGDQFMGSAPQKFEHSGEIKTTTLPAEAIAIIEEDLKKKKLSP